MANLVRELTLASPRVNVSLSAQDDESSPPGISSCLPPWSPGWRKALLVGIALLFAPMPNDLLTNQSSAKTAAKPTNERDMFAAPWSKATKGDDRSSSPMDGDACGGGGEGDGGN